jgi:hypothetical protein
MPARTYDKYLSKEIIEESKYPEITAPMVNYRGDRGGRDLAFQWSCITQPLVMDKEAEVSDRDQFLLFASTNLEDMSDFRAEIELPLGEKKAKQLITEPKFVYVPAGLPHGPITVSSVDGSIALWHFHLDTKYSENWLPSDYSRLVVSPGISGFGGTKLSEEQRDALAGGFDEPNVKITEVGGVPFRYVRSPKTAAVSCWCKPLGIQANLCTGAFAIKYRDWFTMEPLHYHRKFDEWLIFLGGNPLNVEEFDAEIEMFWGREQEKQVVDRTCVAHVPPGLVHVGQEHRRVGKPFWESITVAGTGDYFAEIEKVILSREERGEVMISPGSQDWVPLTDE